MHIFYCLTENFISTMLTCEGIDEMARFAGKYEEVKALTIKAMGGNMSFRQCLTERLGIIQPTSDMVSFFCLSTLNIFVQYMFAVM